MSDKREINPVYFTLLLTALTGVLAYVVEEPALKSPRPKSELPQTHAAWGDQKVLARLWEDPFSSPKAGSNDLLKPTDLGTQIMRRKTNYMTGATTANVSILGVFVEGFPYAEDREVRLRLRYATQKALLDAGYTPEDRNHIGLFQLAWPKGLVLWTNRLNSITGLDIPPGTNQAWDKLQIPFEWHIGGSTASPTNRLVLWLKEEAFADYPLQRIYLMARQIGVANGVAVSIVGPRSSDTLRAVAAGTHTAYKTNDTNYVEWLRSVAIASPEATAEDALVWKDAKAGIGRDYTASSLAVPPRLASFTNLISTDLALASKLVDELVLRRVTVCSNSSDGIVLIAERDTLYGRALPACFAAAYESKCSTGAADLAAVLLDYYLHSDKLPPQIQNFGYLRGLDGSTVSQGDAPRRQPSSEKLTELPARNRAEGDAQMDYARRLTREIKDSVATNRWSYKQPRAIGVLGSDIYDKLVLLQALRPEFPDAIFFTTDLDARLLDPELKPITRNLTVASAYDLKPTSNELGGASAATISPFRDSYQTAVYLACRNLLGAPTQCGEPRLFEIGRTRPVELDVDKPLTWRGVGWAALDFLMLLLILGAAAATVAWAWKGEGRWSDSEVVAFSGTMSEAELSEIGAIRKRRSMWLWRVRLATVAGILLVYCFATADGHSRKGEPFLFFEGVSIWPTALIRIGIIGLCMGLLVRMWHKHQRHRLLLRAEFFGANDEFVKGWFKRVILKKEELFRKLGFWLWLGRGCRLCRLNWERNVKNLIRQLVEWWQHLGGRLPRSRQKSTEIDANQLFHIYVKRALLPNRITRFLPFSALYLGVALVGIFYFGMPYSPLRGGVAFGFDRCALAGCIAAWLLVAFYVLDAVRTSRRLLARLGEGRTRWPERVLNAVAENREMDPSHLSGYLDVVFTAKHSREVYQLIFYPMVVLLLMIVARVDLFERWTWPPALLVVFSLNGLLLLGSAVMLRRSAARVRDAALHELELLQARFAGGARHSSGAERKNYGESLRLVLDEVRDIRAGAYAPWPADLALIAALIPTGGAGLMSLLQTFLQ